MPRKSVTQPVKKDTKDTAQEVKTEAGAPRRSGRAVTKQESGSGKEATRSRRSSTAAQTAASVADSKSPKSRNSVSSRRDSSSPSDSRSRTSRESGLESPATRVKSTRRNAGRVNYKESDGEEEVAAVPKNDENFDSNEEFEDSDSDEKAKPKGKSKPIKSPAKGRSPKEKSKGARVRRGRPTKKKSYDDDDSDTFDVSEDSVEQIEPDNPAPVRKKGKASPNKDNEVPARSGRGRKGKADSVTTEEKAKPSRRSARAVSNKEETTSKRPSRSLQTKRYTEEEDDDIEEISDSKVEDDYQGKSSTGSPRKRKRNSNSEPNKRLKEDEDDVEKEKETENSEEKEDVSEKKHHTKEKEELDESADEPMEIDETDETKKLDEKPIHKKESDESKNESAEAVKESIDKNVQQSSTNPSPAKGKLTTSDKQESVDSFENLDESLHSSDSEQESRDHSMSSGVDDSQETKKEEKSAKSMTETNKQQSEASQSSESLDENSGESKSFQSTAKVAEKISENVPDKVESNANPKVAASTTEGTDLKNASSDATKISESNPTNASSSANLPSNVIHSKELNTDASVNGAERTTVVNNPTRIVHPTSSVIFEHKESLTPKANGAHENLHSNSTSPSDDFPFPGRKYISNSKLSENRQTLKDKAFGFLSYNLGSSSDAYMQKDKLLHELNKLEADIICLQQVARSFYTSVLEPSLDALGFKGVFRQPEGSVKGMATFYKTSVFKLFVICDVSLKITIDKELDAASLDSSDKAAVRSHLGKCGFVLFTEFLNLLGSETVTVGNVQIPRSDLSIHALQVSCLAREAATLISGTNKALLLGGEFNMAEGEAPYQLLRDGYLSNDMIEELQRRKDVMLPGKENAALINLLWKAFQHPSSDLCSCYTSVLDHELLIPEQKIPSPDLLWYSSDSLHTLGVLDVTSDKPGDSHFSLKADFAFSV